MNKISKKEIDNKFNLDSNKLNIVTNYELNKLRNKVFISKVI
jgi:hypothetical protein